MKRVALFTTFFEAKSGYSLVRVAETQIRSLLDHGYEPVVLVQKPYYKDKNGEEHVGEFEEIPPPSVWNQSIVDLRSAVPPMELTPGLHDDFEGRVKRIYQALVENLRDVDVCVTHDIILQEFYKEHNVAMRQYAQTRPDLLWLHWIHSCPTPAATTEYPWDCRYTAPPGYVVYPNDADKGIVCRAYRLTGQEWRIKACRAGHAIDPLMAWRYDKLTKDLARAADLLGGEVVAVYPARLDRGKQVEKVVRLMAGVARAGYDPRLLVIDWQSTGERFQRYIDELLELAGRQKLNGQVSFTSRLDDRCSTGVPPHVVLELMDLSNVYVHPSAVETYSLTVHEAISRGKLAVLNHDFPAMRELFGDAAIYFDFGSDRVNRVYEPDEQAFWDDEAKRLIAELKQNRAVMAQTRARREWTPQALWREFESLFYLQPVGAS